MAKWRKRFAAWADARAPIPVDEAGALLTRIFGERLAEHTGTSHKWTIETPELIGVSKDFQHGRFGVPVKRGTHVLAPYVRVAFQAAALLDLFDPDRNHEQDDDDA